jgi:4,5-dihydroxyphthalate decarboxylase
VAELPFLLATGEHERARPLAEGRVQATGLKLTTVMMRNNGARHERFRAGEFDGCELSFANYLAAWAQDPDFAAIPVFLNRQFRHASIFVNAEAGISTPKDLEGKRVGLLSWLNSAALWARGALAHEYGVDLTRISWLTAGGGEVEGFSPPARFDVQPLASGKRLPEPLLSAEIDALITPRVIAREYAPRVARLFPNFDEVEMAYYGKTGIFPMSHALVVRKALLEAHPGLAESLFLACQEAKQLAYDYAYDPEHSTLAWFGAAMERETAVFGGDGWPYGIEPNRKTLEALVTYAQESGLLDNEPPIEDLFHPSARGL